MSSESIQPSLANRILFADLLRGWAILIMIETHVFNATIQVPLRETGWYTILDFANGLVAPSFLFVSGFVFVVSSARKRDDLLSFGSRFWKQLGRILAIWIVAYGLHLPAFSYEQMFTQTSEQGWLQFFQADILHCIVVGWLFSLASFLAIRSTESYRSWLTASAAAIVLITPFIWDIDFIKYLPAPVSAYFNGAHYSLFPIFPWLGFMLAGSVVALHYRNATEAGRQDEFRRRLTLFGIGGVVASVLFLQIHLDVFFLSSSLRSNPLFFILRLSIVLLLLVLCWKYVEKRGSGRSFIYDASKESFLVYTAHLLIIYGDYWDEKSIARIVKHSWGPLECASATIALTTAMIFLARGWGWLKSQSRTTARFVTWSVVAVVVTVFFLR